MERVGRRLVDEEVRDALISVVGGVLDDELRARVVGGEKDGARAAEDDVGLLELAAVILRHVGAPERLLPDTYDRRATILGGVRGVVTRD